MHEKGGPFGTKWTRRYFYLAARQHGMTKIAKQLTQRRRGITGRLRRKKNSSSPHFPHPPFSLSLKALGPWLYQKNLGGTEKYLHVLSHFLATSRQATAVAKSLDVFFEIGDRKTAANGVRNATIAPTSLEVRAPTEPSKVGILPSRRGTKVFFGFWPSTSRHYLVPHEKSTTRLASPSHH